MEQVPDILIRRMRNADEARFCAQMLAESEPWLTLRRTFEDNFKFLSDPAKEAYVAVSGETLVGVLLLHLRGPLHGYLQTIAVMPKYRGAGVGVRLIRFAEERIFQESPNVFLCVSSFNSRARRLYGKLGYEQAGEFKDYIVKGHSEILLRKTRGPLADFRSQVTA